MTPPGTFERVYAAIRKRLREGAYRPGERLEPAALSDELNASVTPVRDALHRLTGERMVESPRHEGFRAPMMTETSLRHLYAWHLDLLLLALMNHRAGASMELLPEMEAGPGASGQERENALFLAFARSAGNPEHVAAFEGLTHRLEPIQRFERAFLDGTEAETAGIIDAFEAHDRKAIRLALIRYHRRRQKIVPDLLATMLES